MKHAIEIFFRIALFIVTFLVFSWAIYQPLSHIMNLFIIVGGELLMLPIVWFGRKMLDRHPTVSRTTWITIFVHYALAILLGVPLIRVIVTHQYWPDWKLPIPVEIGLVLVIVTGAATLLAIINLALKGFGAPFAIVLSKKLAADWLYAWTRNPMVLAGLAFLLSLGIWFQSTLFLLWEFILFIPVYLAYVKIYEERELEIRFGASYLEYKSRTPMLFPRKPRK